MSQTDALHPPRPAALIIGAGIAGIQAALDIADAGYHVYLVERDPSVGGRMAQLDKTFPTLDCSSCILTPKMVDVGRHPNITLLTYSEVEWVKRDGGRFHARIRKKARSVDEDKCTGCGVCTEHCIVRNAPYIADRRISESANGRMGESANRRIGGSESEGPEE